MDRTDNSRELDSRDSEILDLTSEVKSLTNQKTNLIVEINGLAEKISKAKEELIALEANGKSIVQAAKDEAQRIKDEASVLHDKVKDRLKDLINKESAVNDKEKNIAVSQKAAYDLIKSNEGIKKDLEIQTMEVSRKSAKLDNVLRTVKEVLDEV